MSVALKQMLRVWSSVARIPSSESPLLNPTATGRSWPSFCDKFALKGVSNVEMAASFVARGCQSDESPTGPDNVSSFEPPREYQETIGIHAFYAVNAVWDRTMGCRDWGSIGACVVNLRSSRNCRITRRDVLSLTSPMADNPRVGSGRAGNRKPVRTPRFRFIRCVNRYRTGLHTGNQDRRHFAMISELIVQ